MKTALGVFIGAFQPFHIGHLEIVKTALKECDKLLVVVEDANAERSVDLPFTYAERREMILNSLDVANEVPFVRIMPLDCFDSTAFAVNRVAEMMDRYRDSYDDPILFDRKTEWSTLLDAATRQATDFPYVQHIKSEHIRNSFFSHSCQGTISCYAVDVESFAAIVPQGSRDVMKRLADNVVEYHVLCTAYAKEHSEECKD